LGGFGWTVTFSRGATAGFVVGLAITSIKRLLMTPRRSAIYLVIATTVMLTLAFAPIPWTTVKDIYLSHDDDINGRASAAQLGLEYLTESPLVGAPRDAFWPGMVSPHQIPLYFAAMHGVIVGLLSTCLICLLITPTCVLRSGYRHSDSYLLFMSVIGWVLLGTAITNNFSAPLLFWTVCGMAWTPWAYGLTSRRRQLLQSLRTDGALGASLIACRRGIRQRTASQGTAST
jgi:hypothetical protein